MRTSKYVDASSPDVEIVSLEVVEIDEPKSISLRDNPTPSSKVVIKSTSTFPNLFLEETNTFDNSIPESETFRFNLEEISSSSPTTHSDYSSDYNAYLKRDNDHFLKRRVVAVPLLMLIFLNMMPPPGWNPLFFDLFE
ncbi:hypothetical protein Tco_0977599 [Tanacetum coccineum]|uniref:Uncharacterized protein n=1 Tax=Tanacetum coccineum TaxID=301880 RepID=A0ABQ5EKZ8_9ASTR